MANWIGDVNVTYSWGGGRSWGVLAEKFPNIKIKSVVFRDNLTIVNWSDGDKTILKCENEEFDPEKGISIAIVKKLYGCYTVIQEALDGAYHQNVDWDNSKELERLEKLRNQKKK